ncbi:MAG: response regulator, partial [Tepidisphaeraceae bacterium]
TEASTELPAVEVAETSPVSVVARQEVVEAVTSEHAPHLESPDVSSAESTVDDDSDRINPGDRVLLIVENDIHFARFLMDMGHENGFKAIVTTRGSAALQLARRLKPDAITLDINLPDIDGWRVLNRLKDDPVTRHIPVQIITTDDERERGLRMGAMGALTKPVKTKETLDDAFAHIKAYIEPKTRSAVVVEGDPAVRQAMVDAVAGEGITVTPLASAAEGLAALQKLAADDATPDLIVASLELPDRKGFDLVDEIHEAPPLREVPLILFSQRELTKKEEVHLKRLTQTTVLKDVRSLDRLVDEAALFLHRRLDALPDHRRLLMERLHEPGTVLAGKKVLVVDDDIRNIFAMTSLLEPYRMQILSAETGKAAIEILQSSADIDCVLMDIMMPDVDGYDTMRAIRKLSKFRSLPIIALTAKAMKGDREKCIEAGASDYISKPVDTEQLLALLRVWIYR